MCAAGLISTAECSHKIGITDRSVRRLKARFNACGYAVFVHGNAWKKRAKKYDYEKIARDYQLFFVALPLVLSVMIARIFSAIPRLAMLHGRENTQHGRTRQKIFTLKYNIYHSGWHTTITEFFIYIIKYTTVIAVC